VWARCGLRVVRKLIDIVRRLTPSAVINPSPPNINVGGDRDINVGGNREWLGSCVARPINLGDRGGCFEKRATLRFGGGPFPEGDIRGRCLTDPETSSGGALGTNSALRRGMSNWKTLLATGLLGLMLPFSAGSAQAAVVIIHHGPREAPPTIVEEHPAPRRGYIWINGHHRYRHHRYHWVRGHYVRERRGWGYEPGHWDRHGDHYDWSDGGWRPHR
jgi:hypothetical protein